MITIKDKNTVRQRIHSRIRRKISGTATMPRVNVFRSNNHLYVQVIDDSVGKTIAAASTQALDLRANIAGATAVGTHVGEALKKLGITTVVFDRGGYLYHGKVKAIAEAIRALGIDF